VPLKQIHKDFMGQLNFFMTENEIVHEVNQLILSNNFTIFDKSFFDDEIPKSISSITNANQISRFIIWVNNSNSEPKCSSNAAGDFKGKFLFNIYKDPIIELDFGHAVDNVIPASRLYYKTGWIENEGLRDVHTKSTNRIARTFKKKLTTTKRLKPFYISQDIIKRLEEGFEVELGTGGMRVSKLELNGT
jgi:hypothetical protein